jgi:hypothetical protein
VSTGDDGFFVRDDLDAEDPAPFERANNLVLTSSATFSLQRRVRSEVSTASGTYTVQGTAFVFRVVRRTGHFIEGPSVLKGSLSHDHQTIELEGLKYEAE